MRTDAVIEVGRSIYASYAPKSRHVSNRQPEGVQGRTFAHDPPLPVRANQQHKSDNTRISEPHPCTGEILKTAGRYPNRCQQRQLVRATECRPRSVFDDQLPGQSRSHSTCVLSQDGAYSAGRFTSQGATAPGSPGLLKFDYVALADAPGVYHCHIIEL